MFSSDVTNDHIFVIITVYFKFFMILSLYIYITNKLMIKKYMKKKHEIKLKF